MPRASIDIRYELYETRPTQDEQNPAMPDRFDSTLHIPVPLPSLTEAYLHPGYYLPLFPCISRMTA